MKNLFSTALLIGAATALTLRADTTKHGRNKPVNNNVAQTKQNDDIELPEKEDIVMAQGTYNGGRSKFADLG